MNPYLTPKTNVSENAIYADYRAKFWPPFVLALLFSHAAAAVVLTLDCLPTGHYLPKGVMLAILGIVTACAAVSTALVTIYLRVYANEEGVRCFDFWGKYHLVSWREVSQVRPIIFLWSGYLRMDSQFRPPISLFLHRQRDLWICIHGWAPGRAVDDYARRSRREVTR